MKYATWLVALLLLATGSAMIIASSVDAPYTLDRMLMEQVACDLTLFAADQGLKVQVRSTEFARNERGFAAISPVDEGGVSLARMERADPGRTLAAVYLDPADGFWPDFEAGHYVVQLQALDGGWQVVLIDDWGKVRASGEARIRSEELVQLSTEVSIRPESAGCRLVYRSPELTLETSLS